MTNFTLLDSIPSWPPQACPRFPFAESRCFTPKPVVCSLSSATYYFDLSPRVHEPCFLIDHPRCLTPPTLLFFVPGALSFPAWAFASKILIRELSLLLIF